MLRFPGFDSLYRQLIIGIAIGFASYVQHHSRSEKFLRGNFVHRRRSWREMRRRVHVRAIMLQHPEAAREVAVLFDSRVYFRFECLGVTRPRHHFVADRITQINDSRFAIRNIFH